MFDLYTKYYAPKLNNRLYKRDWQMNAQENTQSLQKQTLWIS